MQTENDYHSILRINRISLVFELLFGPKKLFNSHLRHHFGLKETVMGMFYFYYFTDNQLIKKVMGRLTDNKNI